MVSQQGRCLPLALALGGLALGATQAWSQVCNPGGFHGYDPLPGAVPATKNCVGLFWCHPPQLVFEGYETRPAGCDPTAGPCTVRANVHGTFPGSSGNSTAIGFFDSPTKLTWSLGGGFVGSCGNAGGRIQNDQGRVWIQAGNFSCANPAATTGTGVFKLTALQCDGACPHTRTLDVDLTAPAIEAALCPSPVDYTCNDEGSCRTCIAGGASVGGGGASAGGPGTGPKALLYYRAGGVGHTGSPGAVAHNVTLGRYWIHSYAERVVEEPGGVAWLLTRFGAFARFGDGNLDGLYEAVSPGDEYRTLEKLAGGTFELRGLDGTIDRFDAAGLWTATEDRNGNTRAATYTAGRLSRVDFPDGRREDFTYHPDGKLATITEVGIDGTTTRTWSYTWAGADLERIDRPDSTTIEYAYDDPSHSGFLTRVTLIATDASERILAAYDHDAEGNVVGAWRGAPGPSDPGAVDQWTLAFDDPERPEEATVTDPLGNVSTYTLAGRASRGVKPKLVELSGSCPACGLGPNTQLAYGDAANPYRPTQEIDGKGHVTRYAYDIDGMTTSRIEAFGTALERETTWEYDPVFPAFATEVVRPSVTGNPFDERRMSTVYDADGDATSRTIAGFEDDSTFSLTTTTTYNAAGQPTAINPPGFGTADLTSFTYDPARGNLFALTRTDPVVGTTSFDYDAFNRQTLVTDLNGVDTVTDYDALDRVTQMTHKGAVPAEDLVTEHEYNVFGDLFRTTLPRGNVIEYGHDDAGRLVSIERKPDAATAGERTVYVLDAFGHRTTEERQRWNGAAWETDSTTDFVYSTRCHLDQVIHADGSKTEYNHDCDGNLEREWDANHPSAGMTNPATRVYAYDALDRLTSVTEPWGGAGGGNAVTTYGYDVQDHLASVTDAEGSTTSYEYSDRDLMTEEDSPVSGVTTHTYDEHGSLETTTDARSVTVVRTYDAADRVTFVNYPDPTLDTTYTYDDPGVAFSQGRLTAITRDGLSVDYEYDRFGRTTQDGELTYAYDENGNRTEIGYPGGGVARYTHDFADRKATLEFEPAAGSPQPIVTSATYYAGGPLSSVELGNGLTETRVHDQRYLPDRITVAPTGGGAALLDWQYTTDAVGSPTFIDDLLGGVDRDYGYQDFQYYLTEGDGPWGTLDWTYDRIGNRLTESRNGGAADVYGYQKNGVLGNTAKLTSIQHGIGGTTSFNYDAAGNQTRTTTAGVVTDWTYDDASRLSRIARAVPVSYTDFFYDGRSFLRRAESHGQNISGAGIFCDGFESGGTSVWGNGPGTCMADQETVPIYGSEGVLSARNEAIVLYFAGRPIALVDDGVDYISVDHLGTSSLFTDGASAVIWRGGFEPFGGDYAGAMYGGMFLRFPGQWDDFAWSGHIPRGMYYNVHRWYEAGTGSYSRPDPFGLVDPNTFSPVSALGSHIEMVYGYAERNPLLRIDPFGQRSRVCCRKIPGLGAFRHCAIQIEQDGISTTCGLFGGRFTPGEQRGTGLIRPDHPFDTPGSPDIDCGPWNESCFVDQCVIDTANSYANPSLYRVVRGPNSNTFAGTVARACGLSRPQSIGSTPGWDDPPAPPKEGATPQAGECKLP